MVKISKGFSLLEVIIALTIVGILAVISIPSITQLIQNHRLDATTEKLYYDLQYARSEAVKNNITVYVTFQTGDNWCYGINSGSACNCTIANNCNLTAAATPTPQQITLSVSAGLSSGLQFEGTRGAANASGTLTFTVYGQAVAKTITVGRLGSLQLA